MHFYASLQNTENHGTDKGQHCRRQWGGVEWDGTVAGMLFIFPCVKLHCVSSARESCLDYVWPVDVHMLFV